MIYRKQRNKTITTRIWEGIVSVFSNTCLAENETGSFLITMFEFTVLCDISQSGSPGNTNRSARLLWAKTMAARNIKYVSLLLQKYKLEYLFEIRLEKG